MHGTANLCKVMSERAQNVTSQVNSFTRIKSGYEKTLLARA